MRICFLTQTASDISEDYKEFFREKDLFFITFKNPNPNALAFAPKSTWSDGRNKLWEMVKDKYDYYVFMDDDLIFHNFKNRINHPLLAYFYYKFYTKDYAGSFEKSNPDFFFNRLKYYLSKYKPEIMSLTQLDNNPVNKLDTAGMRNNSFIRRSGFFDAQFTVMSNYAANKLMPYDTSISGWSSSQIPIYLYAFHVFASKAINLSQLAVANGFHVGAYAENYDGMLDCKKMIKKISEVTNKDYSSLGSVDNNHAVSYLYGEKAILTKFPKPGSVEDYKINYANNLSGLENLLHSNVVI